MEREVQGADPGSDEQVALIELQDEIQQFATDREQQARETTLPLLDRIRAAYQDAQRRYDERYGSRVSFALECPVPTGLDLPLL